MRIAPWALAVAATFAATVAAAAPQSLSFSAGGDRHLVPSAGIASLDVGEEGGLTLCFSESEQQALRDFTADHIGDTVTVSIGETDVFFLQVVEPYAGGCIDWPLHPRVAESYRARLTGTSGDE